MPHDPEGYAVDRASGVVHCRYADHLPAHALRTRKAAGVQAYLGTEPTVCRRCWPNYRKPRKRR
jgi:hypothetical protein